MAKSGRPNILFMFSDQQRWDTMGCYGQKLPITPNLDRLAKEGTLFRNAYTCQPVCGPARACLQTGKYATEMGVYRNAIRLPENEETLATMLTAAGYEVGYIGKWHLGASQTAKGEGDPKCGAGPVPPERRGGYKDYWLAAQILEFTSHGYDGSMWDADMKEVKFKGYRVDCITDFVLQYLRTRTLEKPFFLFLSYLEPHHQNDHKVYEGPIGSKEKWKDYEVPGDLVGTQGDWRENFPDYLGCCNSLDYNFGRIRAELEKLKLWDNTFFVYTSDHGSHFRTRNAEYKRACHDACIHVPMIIHGAGFNGGKTVDEMVSLIDLPPTVVSAGGVKPPKTMRGKALQKLVSGKAKGWPEEVFMQISESEVGRAIRTKKWTYSVVAPDKDGWADSASDVYVEDYLYDNEADPHQRNNLVKEASLAKVREGLAKTLVKYMVEIGEQRPKIEPAK
jgi:uncharacterized sulfatase